MTRPRGPWATVSVLLVGCLAPVVAYRLDRLLRYRVSAWVRPQHRFLGVLEVLMAQARDQPVSLLALVAAPLAAIGFVVVVWMRRRARARTGPRQGIGGWLAVFVLATILGVVLNIHGLYVARHAIWVNLRALPHLERTMAPALVRLIVARHLVAVVSTVALVAGLWLIVRRSARAAAYWTVVCAVLAPVHLYEGAIAAWERRVAASVHIVLFPNAHVGRAAIISAVAVLGWCLYWMRSRRVSATFGRRGLDLFVERGSSSELAAMPTTEMPPR